MNIAITGGTGFVGRHLAKSLTNQGHKVILIARGVNSGPNWPPFLNEIGHRF